MTPKTIHLQFDKDNKYIGKVDPADEIQSGHFNVEVSHDEHEDVEKNKEDADHIHKFLGGKTKIDNEKRLEGLKMQEQQTIDEISDETKGSYLQKAHKDIEKRNVFDKDGMRKVSNRLKGQQRAAKSYKGGEEIDIKEFALDEATLRELSKMDADELGMEAFKASKEANDSNSIEKHHRASKLHSMAAEKHTANGVADLAAMHDKHYNRHLDRVESLAGFVKESFGAQILDHIINNKPINAQEQCAFAMSSIIKDKIDSMKQDVAQRIFNKSVNEGYSDVDWHKVGQYKHYGEGEMPNVIKNSHQGTRVTIANPHHPGHGIVGKLTGTGTTGTSEVDFGDRYPKQHIPHQYLAIHTGN